MKNVIILVTGDIRCAIELRWVREVLSLGQVTPVPRSPAFLLGAAHVHGCIVPVIDLLALLPGSTHPGAPTSPAAHGRQLSGCSAIVVDVDGTAAALAVDTVYEVATVALPDPDEADVLTPTVDPDPRIGIARDSQGRDLLLVSPPVLLDIARAQAENGRGDADGTTENAAYHRGDTSTTHAGGVRGVRQ